MQASAVPPDSLTLNSRTPKALFSPHSWLQRGSRFMYGLLLHKSMLTVLDQAIVAAANFVTAVMIGRLSSQDALGVYSLALSIVVFARGVQENLISAPYLVYCHRRTDEARVTYVGSVMAHQAVLTGLLMIALLLGIRVTSWSGPAGLPSVLLVLLWAMPFLLLREFVRHLAFAHLRPSVALAVDIGAGGLQIGGLLLFAAFDQLTIPAVFGVMGLSCAATCIGWLLWKREPIQFERQRIWKDWQQNLAFGKWSLLSMLLGSAAYYVIPWILASTVDVAEAGVFYACQTLVAVANMFALGFSRFLSPRAAQAMVEGGISELVSVLKRGAVLFVVVLGVFSLVAVFGGGPLVQLVYGGRYSGAGLTFGFLALTALAGSLGIISGNGLWALDRPSANIPADVVTFVITITTAIAITGSLGALGAAVAIFAGIGVGTTVRVWTLRQHIRRYLGEAAAR